MNASIHVDVYRQDYILGGGGDRSIFLARPCRRSRVETHCYIAWTDLIHQGGPAGMLTA